VKILFTSTHVPSFIREDVEILQEHFHVDHLITRGWTSLFTIPARILRADATFTWFASVYSALVVLFARLLHKQSVIVVGGVDVAKYPEINYGIWLTPWKAVLVKYALRNARKVLIVDPFQRQEAMRLAAYDGGNIEYVPTGYDPNFWISSGSKEPMVLMVAACQDEGRMRTKGVDFLLGAAALLPDTKFLLVGLGKETVERVRHLASSNVEVVPFVQRNELLGYYQRARVYCQTSYIEGLPNSLCEAMLCGCIPVGTNVGGIPTAISDIGFLVEYGDTAGLGKAIRDALLAPDSVGIRAREHIAKNFTLQRREEALVRILTETLQ